MSSVNSPQLDQYEGIPKPWLYGISKHTLDFVNNFSGLTITGQENIPDGQIIVASDHYGFADIGDLSKAFPDKNLQFVGKIELEEPKITVAGRKISLKIFGNLLKNCGVLFLDRDNPQPEVLHAMVQVLLSPDGNSLGLFPAGTISKDGQNQRAKRGVGIAACLSGRQISPTAIKGTEHPWWSPFTLNAVVCVGKPVDPEPIPFEYDPSLDLTPDGLLRDKVFLKAVSKTTRNTQKAIDETREKACKIYEDKQRVRIKNS